MRILGVAMVRNEADVIEAFVRHNLSRLDGLSLIDHASCDGTGEILARLRAEGLPLRVRAEPAPGFDQSRHVTALTRDALAHDGADFVFALDADEFIKAQSRDVLERALAQVPAGMHGLVHWLTYVPTSFDDATQPFGRDHLRRRRVQEGHGLHKVIAGRGLLDRPSETVWAGNHVIADAQTHAPSRQALLRADAVALAHCPVRSRAQLEGKIVIGHLAYLAAAGGDTGLGFHWRDLYDELRAGAVLGPDRLKNIAVNYGLPRERWQPWAEADLVDDPVDFAVRQRYGTHAAIGSLQRLMRFAEDVLHERPQTRE